MTLETAMDEEWLAPDQADVALSQLKNRRPFLQRSLMLSLLLAAVVLAWRSPSSESPLGPPPTDRQLVWFSSETTRDPLAIHLEAFDWTGQRLGMLSLPCRGPCGYSTSPDGQRVIVFEEPFIGQPRIPGSVYDVSGRWLGAVANPSGMWADDSRHVCNLAAPTSITPSNSVSAIAKLRVADLSGTEGREVTSVTSNDGAAAAGWWQLLACSVKSDRAVLAFADGDAVYDLLVIRLSTGERLFERREPSSGNGCGCPISLAVASANASVLVENMGAAGIEIRNLSTGGVRTWRSAWAGWGQAVWLSWKGNRALTPDGIVELGTDRVLWRPPSPSSASLAGLRPGTDDVLVYLWPPDETRTWELILGSDGSRIPISHTQAFTP